MTGAKNLAVAAALTVVIALCCTASVESTADHQTTPDDIIKLMDIIDGLFESVDTYQLAPGVRIKKSTDDEARAAEYVTVTDRQNDPEKYLYDRIAQFASTHVLDVNFSEMFQSAGRTFSSLKHLPRLNFGKNSFLTGFGLGFLAFGLKKLLLPIIIGVQILKSIAFAALLPTLLGSFGKVLSKGVSNFASSSGHFHPIGGADGLNDFEFKDQQPNYGLGYDTAAAADTSGSETGYQNIWTYPPDNSANAISASYSNSRYPVKYGQNSMSSTKLQSGNYYTKDKTEDFKVFHNIPSSSHLLANYDPFYSPLLSRIDTVFKQLGYATEPCRERLVCQMYKNPAKFAPYSNLISAQLSRELNELRKPSSENPEILRFFKYMKAAKDGQDNQACEIVFSGCMSSRSPDDSVPMMTTFNEINKLVQARHAKQVEGSPFVNNDTVATVEMSESYTKLAAATQSEPITKRESEPKPESVTESESIINKPESVIKSESATKSESVTKLESATMTELNTMSVSATLSEPADTKSESSTKSESEARSELASGLESEPKSELATESESATESKSSTATKSESVAIKSETAAKSESDTDSISTTK